MRIAAYQAAGLLPIPLNHDIPHEHSDGVGLHGCATCRWIKRPCVMWKDYTGLSDEQWFRMRSKFRRDHGHASDAPLHEHPPYHSIGLGIMTGPRIEIDGYYPMGIDHDHRRPDIKENLQLYRRLGTWVLFTPSYHYTDLYRVPRRYSMGELLKAGLVCSPDKHDIIWWIPKSQRLPGEKMGLGYFAIPPTTMTINGRARAYFWLDEKKMDDGTLTIKRLDL